MPRLVTFELYGSYRGETVAVNPDEVSSIHGERGHSYNFTTIVMNNGSRYSVKGYENDVVARLNGEK